MTHEQSSVLDNPVGEASDYTDEDVHALDAQEAAARLGFQSVVLQQIGSRAVIIEDGDRLIHVPYRQGMLSGTNIARWWVTAYEESAIEDGDRLIYISHRQWAQNATNLARWWVTAYEESIFEDDPDRYIEAGAYPMLDVHDAQPRNRIDPRKILLFAAGLIGAFSGLLTANALGILASGLFMFLTGILGSIGSTRRATWTAFEAGGLGIAILAVAALLIEAFG